MHQPNTNIAVPFRQRPLLAFNERNNRLHVDHGTLIITSETNFRCGSATFQELRVGEEEITLQVRHCMMFPIEAEDANQHFRMESAALAEHFRMLATPLILNPEEKMQPGIDHILAFAGQYLRSKSLVAKTLA